MDLHDKQLIDDCLAQLMGQFSNSNRVKRIQLMAKYELSQRYDTINKYNDMIANDESNSLLHKRKIAIFISGRNYPLAIRALCEYLKNFLNDTEAWTQLSELYIQEQEYSKAAFCVEELILTNPHNHLYHERYAEIQYTIGTPDSLELARLYYAQAVKLKPLSLRALYGLILSCNALILLSKISIPKKKELLRLTQWASNQVSEIYRQSLSDESEKTLVDSIDSALEALSIN